MTTPKKIMICDDEPFSVEALAQRLRVEGGFDVDITGHPQDCLARAREERFDLFILDVDLGANLPLELPDGLALAKELWKLASAVNVPIVAITGKRPEWKETALALGLVNYFRKPFSLTDVFSKLRGILESRNQARHAMENWLVQAAGDQWQVLDLVVSEGAVMLWSNLVAGSGLLALEGRDLALALRMFHEGYIDEDLFDQVGGRLQEGLFPPKVNVGFHQYRLLSQLANRPFRLLLHLEDPRWEHLPWELCRYSGGTDSGHWLGGDLQLTCARAAPNRGRLLADEELPLPLKVLVVAACPEGTESLDLEGELREIQSAFEPLGDNVVLRLLGPPELNPASEASPQEVDQQLKDFQPAIVHFMSHGLPGKLILEKGGDLALWSDYLLNLNLVGRGVKLLVFNCCLSGHPGDDSSGLAVGGLTAGVTAVVGQFFCVSDEGAKRFTRLLYGGLVAGAALDSAFQEARSRVWSEELREKRPFLPVLFVRDRFLTLNTGPPEGERGSAKALLRHAGSFQFEPGEMNRILAEVDEMRRMEVEPID